MRSNLKWIVCGALVLVAGVTSAADAVRWTNDFRQACDVAAKDRRLVLLHFYSDNCAPCVRVDKEVFSQPQIAQAIERYCVPVKVHVEQTPDLARRYNIQRWPTDVLVTSSGMEVYRTVSPQSPTQYLAMIEQVALHAGARPAAGGQVPVGAAAPAQPSGYPGPYQGGPVTGTFQSQLPASDRTAYEMKNGDATHRNVDTTHQTYYSAPGQANSAAPEVAPTGNPMGPLAPSAQAQTTPYVAASQPTEGGYFQQQGSAPPQNAAVPPAANVYGNQPPATASSPVAYGQMPPQANSGTVAASYGAAPEPQAPPQTVVNRYTQQAPSAYSPPPAAPSVAAAPWGPQNAAVTAPTAPAMPPQAAPSVAATGPYSMQPPTAAAAPPVAPAVANIDQPKMIPSAIAPAVVLDGCCAVSMVETRRLKKADPAFGAVHRGRTYLFVSAAEQAKFLADPDRYAVILSGYDPVRFSKTGELVEGKRQYGMMYQQKIYLMADEESLNQFSASPQFFSTSAHQAMLKSETSATQFR